MDSAAIGKMDHPGFLGDSMKPGVIQKVRQGASVGGVALDVTFDGSIHDRSFVTDTGWRILLGRGLDIFQYVTSDAFDLASRRQEYRQVKAFGITYVRAGA